MDSFLSVLSNPITLAVIGSLTVFKIWLKLTTGIYLCDNKLVGKTIIITGANSGIGMETVKDLAGRGARIVMVCRDMRKAEKVWENIVKETGNTNISMKHIDFCSLSSVRRCAREILNEEPEIHVLLNNAGITSGAFTKTEDGLNTIMQANHLGPFLFTNLLLGRILSSSPGRIINVSSETHRMAKLDLAHLDLSNVTSTTTAYSNTKLCNVLMANELAYRLKGTGITVNSLTPGVVLTDILRDAPSWFRVPWNYIIKVFCKNAEEGAQTSIFACASPQLGDVSGQYFMDCGIKEVSKEGKNLALARKLWELSETMVHLQPEERL